MSSRRSWVTPLLIAAFVLLAILTLWQSWANRQADEQRAAELSARLDQSTAQTEALIGQIESLGERPVVQPDDVPDNVVVEGPQGIPGIQGPPGPQGPMGPAGLDGEDGSNGARGPPGNDGNPGPAGQAGVPGSDGSDGVDGRDGEQGPPGPQGATGPAGPQGPQGPPQSCASEFVCAGELQAALNDYFVKADVLAMLRALGCQVTSDAGNPNEVFTCTITGKP